MKIKNSNIINNNKPTISNKMEDQSNQTKQLCILLRISNCYFGLTLVQLTLTVSYLLAMHNSMIELASWVQIWLALLIFLDLSIKFLSERSKFWFNKWNIMDIGIFVIVVFSVIITCTHADSIHHSANNTMGASIMSIRYIAQIYRVIVLVKTSKQIHEQQKYQGMINLKPGSGLEVDNQICEVVEISH